MAASDAPYPQRGADSVAYTTVDRVQRALLAFTKGRAVDPFLAVAACSPYGGAFLALGTDILEF